MKQIKMWECLKLNHKDFVVFMKYGNFYKVYGDDIYLIWKITGYKVIDDHHIGFPLSSLTKILSRLNVLHISYLIYNRENEYTMVEEVDNQYSILLASSKKEYDQKVRIERLVHHVREKIEGDLDQLEYYEQLWK